MNTILIFLLLMGNTFSFTHTNHLLFSEQEGKSLVAYVELPVSNQFYIKNDTITRVSPNHTYKYHIIDSKLKGHQIVYNIDYIDSDKLNVTLTKDTNQIQVSFTYHNKGKKVTQKEYYYNQ